MLYEERLEAAERRKKEGNALFAEGKYTEALAKYAMVSSSGSSSSRRIQDKLHLRQHVDVSPVGCAAMGGQLRSAW
jgi:hypothetical protein